MGGSENTVGETPLGAAAWAGNLRMCRLLLEHGADPNHVTERGFDALGTAADHRKTAIVEAMIAAGARYAPRHLLQCGLKELLNRVLDREPERLHERIDLGHFNGESGTLLHVAVNEGLEEMVALLLARGADVEARDDKGRTVVCCALEPSHATRSDAIIDLLRRHGARIDDDAVADHRDHGLRRAVPPNRSPTDRPPLDILIDDAHRLVDSSSIDSIVRRNPELSGRSPH